MRARSARGWAFVLGAWLAWSPALEARVERLPAELAAARDATVLALTRDLPQTLPEGAVAILPVEVLDPGAVAEGVAASWPAAWAEALHAERPTLSLAERDRLEAVLREQKFGDSPYADPATAAEVGRLIAARTLLVTRIEQFESERWRVLRVLEASALDVETGANLWSKRIESNFYPLWVKLLAGVLALALVAAVVSAWQREQRRKLVEEKLPAARSEARIEVDGLARAATDARERARAAGDAAGAAALQAAWVDLDAALDRVRHALPGGSVDRSRARDLASAVREAGRLCALLEDLERACTGGDAGDLATRLRAGASELRAAVDAYRRTMS